MEKIEQKFDIDTSKNVIDNSSLKYFYNEVITNKKTILVGDPGSGKSWFLTNFMEVKRYFDFLVLRTPIFGAIIKKMNAARFSRTLSSLIESGVSINKSLSIISRTLTNTYYRESLESATKEVQKGIDLSDTISCHKKLYPILMVNMIKVGEETGTMGNALKQVAEFYEEEVRQVTENLSSIIEPVLMMIIGAAVGFFAISMIQPMYSLMEGI